MRPEKNITITVGSETYDIYVDLRTSKTGLILLTDTSADESSIISMSRVPDKVQILYYKTLRTLTNEYIASNGPSSNTKAGSQDSGPN